ncbi:MAG: glycosyl transferase family 1 [Patescibacteria group bacterium]|nr:MAG: glycosyl transferase family 1 [Patescibacteria group bacterium]
MHVGIDFTSVIYGRGVSRYTQNLSRSLAQLPEIQLTLFGYSLRQKDVLETQAEKIPGVATQFLRLPTSAIEKLWQFGLKPVSGYIPNLDVFHSWDWVQPPDKNIPIVSTIHDLAILKFPKTAHPAILKAHERSWKMLKEHRSHIIAVSQTTKTDIVKLLGYPAYMVHVVHEAVPEEFLKAADSVTEEQELLIKEKLVLNRPYIFFVGTREPRKNLTRLIQAWQPLASEYDLLIAGESGWDESDLAAKQYKYQPRFLGRITDKALSVLYANAEVFAFPSLYEGFGLPILESFHHGTPVVTSNNSGMIEVAGNAAEFVNPESVESITLGLQKILNETTEEQKKRLQRMIIRQQMFNWETTARETVAVYKQAIQDFK